MIKIGTSRDLYKIRHLPIEVRKSISADIKILDENYGINRNVDTDMGGFVVVCNKNEVLNICNFNKDFDRFEDLQEICPYARKHYISGTERNIVIYEKM